MHITAKFNKNAESWFLVSIRLVPASWPRVVDRLSQVTQAFGYGGVWLQLCRKLIQDCASLLWDTPKCAAPRYVQPHHQITSTVSKHHE